MSALQRLRLRLNQNKNLDPDFDGDSQDTSSLKMGGTDKIMDQTTWIQHIQDAGNRAEDWLEFTNYMKNPKQYGSEQTYISYMSSFFARAIKAINVDLHKDNAAYVQLVINMANFKNTYSIEDGRSLLQYARNCGKKLAISYIASAQLEVLQGNIMKGKRLLLKGQQNQAEPAEMLQVALQNLAAGITPLIPDGSITSTEDKENGDPLGKPKDHNAKLNIDHDGIPATVTLRSVRSRLEMSKWSQDKPSAGGGDIVTDNQGFLVPNQMVAQTKLRSLSPRTPSTINETYLDNTVDLVHNEASRSRCQSGNQSDEGDTIPSSFDQDNGVYKRTMKSYHSTPDCKQANMLSSNWKFRSLGKPMRVKRTSLAEGSRANDDQSLNLSPLLETDQFNIAMSEDMSHYEAKKAELPPEDMKVEDAEADTGDGEDFTKGANSDSGFEHSKSLPSTGSTLKAKEDPVHEASVTAGTIQAAAHPTPVYKMPVVTTAPVMTQEKHSASTAVAPSQQVVPMAQPAVHPNMVTPMMPAQAMVQGQQMPHVATTNQPTKMLAVNGKMYTILKLLGRGGSSKVYDTFDESYNLRALKCVNLASADKATITSYKNEITLLKRLQHSNKVVKLFDYEYVDQDDIMYVVMERGDTDLSSLFRQCNKNGSIDSLMQKFYWKEMLKAVDVLHKEGIVHSDLKPANFLLVAGNLKLIDFGIAKTLCQDKTSVICDQQVGTLNYMSPEAVIDTSGGMQKDANGHIIPRIKIGVKSDVWSLGCILYNLVYGKTPFHHISNNFLKLQAISNPRVEINLPENVDPRMRDILMKCLVRDPKQRPSIAELLAYDL